MKHIHTFESFMGESSAQNEIKPGDRFQNYKGSVHTVVSISPSGNQIKATDGGGNVLTFRFYNSSGKYIEGRTNELGSPI